MVQPRLTRAQKRALELNKEFHALLGYCIAEWANVDDSLFEIFQLCVGPYEQSAILYYRMPGLDVRLGTTDEVIRSRYPKKKSGDHTHQDILEWANLHARIGKLLSVRRRLAHQPVRESWNMLAAHMAGISLPSSSPNSKGLGAYFPNEPWHAVHASKHEKVRQRSSDLKPLTKPALEKHWKEVGELSGDLAFFAHGVLPLHLAGSLPPENQKAPATSKDREPAHPIKRKRQPRS